MKTKQTHIGRLRARYACNQRHIRAAIGLGEDAYNNLWLDMGAAFVAERYPPEDARYAAYHRHIMADGGFWRWWRLEWKRREDYFLRAFSGEPHRADKESYIRAMAFLLDDGRVDVGFFENYLIKSNINIINGSDRRKY